MNPNKYIHEIAPPISRLIREKGIVNELTDYLDSRTYAGHFLKKMYLYPELCSLNTYLIISQATQERLDVVIRLAMEVTIKDSVFCIREEYKVPRVVKETNKRVGSHPAAKKAAKKNRVYAYIHKKGYAIRALNTHMGGGSKDIWEERFKNPRNVRLIDVIKVALITRTEIYEVINYLLLGNDAERLKQTTRYCREEVLKDIPKSLPNTSEFVERNYANIVKCTIFNDATELKFTKKRIKGA